MINHQTTHNKQQHNIINLLSVILFWKWSKGKQNQAETHDNLKNDDDINNNQNETNNMIYH